MASRSKSLIRDQDSLLISGINSSSIHKRLDRCAKPNSSNLLSSRLELSSSRVSMDPIRIQDSFSISEIYREVEANKENLLSELYDSPVEAHENSDFFRLLEDNTAINSRHKTYSKLDESSVVGENCQVILQEPEDLLGPLLKKQQRKYYKAFMVLQAMFVTSKDTTDRKIQSLNLQISEVVQLIDEGKDFKNKLEDAVNSKLRVIKEEMLGKFMVEADALMEKYQSRDSAQKNRTKNEIISLRKEIDVAHDKVFRSFDESKAKNSEDLLRKNCEMRLKIALMQADQQRMQED